MKPQGRHPLSQPQPLAHQAKPEAHTGPPCLSRPCHKLSLSLNSLDSYTKFQRRRDGKTWLSFCPCQPAGPAAGFARWCSTPGKTAQTGHGRIRLAAFSRTGAKLAALDLSACVLVYYLSIYLETGSSIAQVGLQLSMLPRQP